MVSTMSFHDGQLGKRICRSQAGGPRIFSSQLLNAFSDELVQRSESQEGRNWGGRLLNTCPHANSEMQTHKIW